MTILKGKKYSILALISSLSFVFIVGFSSLMPMVFVNAAVQVGGGDNKIANPLGTTGPQNLPDFIKAIIKIVLVVGIPILVLAIIYSGFLYVSAQGNPSKLEIAHRNLLYTVIGGALLLGAFVIATAIGQTVKDIGGGV
ncbi:MAG: hypothetical protein NTV03_04060 [Candidatus Nomurabacteria bacterium]|nr:hypothetical protein [Candidatus Nomurabacteria bacterium]